MEPSAEDISRLMKLMSTNDVYMIEIDRKNDDEPRSTNLLSKIGDKVVTLENSDTVLMIYNNKHSDVTFNIKLHMIGQSVISQVQSIQNMTDLKNTIIVGMPQSPIFNGVVKYTLAPGEMILAMLVKTAESNAKISLQILPECPESCTKKEPVPIWVVIVIVILVILLIGAVAMNLLNSRKSMNFRCY